MNTALRNWHPVSKRKQGVLQPLLVRTIEDDKYEVIAGARRLRAAKLAALEEVPVRVVELSDAACVETQLVENIQRENAHPLEEAFAFYGLLHTDGLQYDIPSLAAKTGKSPAFVATRLRLVELHPSIAEAFLADEIGVGHALEIAKLPQQEQQRAFDAAFHTEWNGGKETRILRPVRDLALCGAPHNVNNAESLFMQRSAAGYLTRPSSVREIG
jgi:ParB family chromosome partitioning protein